MNTHLNDEQIGRVVAGLAIGAEAADHLETCLACRRQVEELETLLAARRGVMEEEAPEWEAQLRSVMAALPAQGTRKTRLWRPLATAAAAAAAALGLVILSPHTHRQDRPQISVEQVLNDVDATLAGDPLSGFAPLEELVPDAQELSNYTETTS
jgi:hypothetical protein